MDANNPSNGGSGASGGSNFHSTVLQRPQGDEDARDRHPARRDVLNPVPGSAHHPPGFSLRSPTRTELRPPTFGSPNNTAAPPHAAGQHQSPPRSSAYMASTSPASGAQGPASGPVAPQLPPPVMAAGPNHHQGGPVSPLNPPNLYYPPSRPGATVDSQHARDKASATTSFYDPTTDTTKERRVSDSSWHNAPPSASTPKVSIPVRKEWRRHLCTCNTQYPRLFFSTNVPCAVHHFFTLTSQSPYPKQSGTASLIPCTNPRAKTRTTKKHIAPPSAVPPFFIYTFINHFQPSTTSLTIHQTSTLT